MRRDQCQADKLTKQAEGEELRYRMLLATHCIDLHGQQYDIDEHKDEIHFQQILLIVRELKAQRMCCKVIGVHIHQIDVVLQCAQVGAAAIGLPRQILVRVPLAGCSISITGHQCHIPEAKRRERKLNIRIFRWVSYLIY